MCVSFMHGAIKQRLMGEKGWCAGYKLNTAAIRRLTKMSDTCSKYFSSTKQNLVNALPGGNLSKLKSKKKKEICIFYVVSMIYKYKTFNLLVLFQHQC